jgi:regulator of ribosome biosynthesis
VYDRLFTCPTESTEVGSVIVLPGEVTKLPREKRIPELKPLTKWEKFAKQKGILKKKKDRMIFDEETGVYRPNFGYKRAKNGIEDTPIVEVKAGEDPYADPWTQDRKSKKDRVNKNLENQLKNQLRRNPKKHSSLSYGINYLRALVEIVCSCCDLYLQILRKYLVYL